MKALKIAIPIIIVLLIGAAAFLYFYSGLDLSMDYYINAGDKAAAAGRYDRAAACYEKALDKAGTDSELTLKLADAYEQAGNYTKAEFTLVSGINNDPDTVNLYVELSKVYVAQDKLRDAAILLDGVTNQHAAEQLAALRPEAPVVSPESGLYDEFFTVNVSFPSGSVAYVSTNGDYPSTANPSLETELVTTYGDNTIFAVAVSADGLVSELVSAQYTVSNVVEDVTFTDPSIEAQVRTALGVEDYVQLTTEDLWQISMLFIPSEAVSLEDLRWFTKLPSIKFETTAGFDLSLLSQCTELRQLTVANCGLSSQQLEQIGNLTSLAYLDISGNQLVSLEPVGNLTVLTTLLAADNSIFDVSPLAGLNAITVLDLSLNSIEAIDSLWAMTGMTELNLSGNPITAINELGGMAELESLNLSGCQISDTSPLAGKTKLLTLDCSDNTIDSLDYLADSVNMETLSADNNQIKSIGFITGMKSLAKISAAHNAITAVPDLSGLEKLNIIDLSNNLIDSISGIHDMALLNFLYLDYNNISDISVLTSNYLLVQVDVFANPVEEITMLTDMGIIVNKGVVEEAPVEEPPAEEAPAE